MKNIEIYDEQNIVDRISHEYGSMFNSFFKLEDSINAVENNDFYELFKLWDHFSQKVGGLLTAFLIKADIDFMPYLDKLYGDSMFIVYSPLMGIKELTFSQNFDYSSIANDDFFTENFLSPIDSSRPMTINFNISFDDFKKVLHANIDTLDDLYGYYGIVKDEVILNFLK